MKSIQCLTHKESYNEGGRPLSKLRIGINILKWVNLAGNTKTFVQRVEFIYLGFFMKWPHKMTAAATARW